MTVVTEIVNNLGVIKSFRCKEAENIFNGQGSIKFGAIVRIIMRKLEILDAAENIRDLSIPPGNRLEALLGNRKGQYSIRINDQWRICFVWKDGQAFEVEIADYH